MRRITAATAFAILLFAACGSSGTRTALRSADAPAVSTTLDTTTTTAAEVTTTAPGAPTTTAPTTAPARQVTPTTAQQLTATTAAVTTTTAAPAPTTTTTVAVTTTTAAPTTTTTAPLRKLSALTVTGECPAQIAIAVPEAIDPAALKASLAAQGYALPDTFQFRDAQGRPIAAALERNTDDALKQWKQCFDALGGKKASIKIKPVPGESGSTAFAVFVTDEVATTVGPYGTVAVSA